MEMDSVGVGGYLILFRSLSTPSESLWDPGERTPEKKF